jgi:hypothetical protein
MPATPGVDDYVVRQPDIGAAYRDGQRLAMERARYSASQADQAYRRKEQEQLRMEQLQQRYGDALVVNPQTGDIDVTASERSLQQRKIQDKMAFQFGFNYAFGDGATVLTPDEEKLIGTPQGRYGIAEGMAAKQKEQASMDRIIRTQDEIGKRQLDTLKERGAIEAAAALQKSLFTPEKVVRNVRWKDGDTTRTGTEEEYQAWERESKMAKEDDELVSEEDAIIEGILKEKAKAAKMAREGKGMDLEDLDAEVPKVESSWMMDDSPTFVQSTLDKKLSEVKARKRKKIEDARKKRGGTVAEEVMAPGSGVLRAQPDDVDASGDVMIPYRPR